MPNSSNKVSGKILGKVLAALFPFFILSALIGFSGCAKRGAILTKAPSPRLVLPLFKNSTFEPLLEKTLTPIFKTSLYERGWNISENTDQIAKTLVGQITRFGRHPISLDQVGGAREYRINISLKIAVLESKGGEESFSKTVEGVAEYIARADSGDDRLAKDRAIREAGRDMAEQVADLLRNMIDQQKNGRK